MSRAGLISTVLAIMALIQGCAPGFNSVLFATKSNVGFNYDTAPPTLEVAMSRYEGVLEPTFEGGETLPVMASFSSNWGVLRDFFWGVKSTFATGEAAYIMTYLYADPDSGEIAYPPLTLSTVPASTPLGRQIRYILPGNARPVLFGTDSTLGIKIRWEGQTATLPSSANIGFKRKEGALAPIAVRPTKNPNEFHADVASLLATIDTDVSTPGARFRYLQYFATGAAANNLARRQAVRVAMLERADPTQNIQAAAAEAKQAATNKPVINQICAKFDGFKDDSQKQETILKEAQRLKLVGDKATIKNFKNYLAVKEREGPPTPDNLQKLLEFASKLP